MEPSQVLAAAGEFSGNESGWTAYIGSPIYNDDEQSVDIEEYSNNYKNTHGNDDDDDDGDSKNTDDDDGDSKHTDDEESDDSMASDASSGPSHLQLLCINSEGSHGSDQLKHADNDHKMLFSGKRAGKQERKTRYGRKVEKEEDKEEEDFLLEADSASSHV